MAAHVWKENENILQERVYVCVHTNAYTQIVSYIDEKVSKSTKLSMSTKFKDIHHISPIR